jgi:hypothetical protein
MDNPDHGPETRLPHGPDIAVIETGCDTAQGTAQDTAQDTATDTASDTSGRPAHAAPGKPLSDAARRALEEAAARRAARDAKTAELTTEREIDGRGGLEPVRYGDWEIKGLASDF